MEFIFYGHPFEVETTPQKRHTDDVHVRVMQGMWRRAGQVHGLDAGGFQARADLYNRNPVYKWFADFQSAVKFVAEKFLRDTQWLDKS